MPNPSSKLANFMKEPIKGAFDFFGKNPDSAIYVAVAIAGFKGIFRPIFTLRDKKSDPQTKKYTAIREALTELIAIPIYIAVPLLGKKLFVDKKFKNASDVVKKSANSNIKFWGVLASTAIIPAVCNLVQPPIMNALKKKQEAKKELAVNNNIPTVDKTNKPSFSGNSPLATKTPFKNNFGMRVGS